MSDCRTTLTTAHPSELTKSAVATAKMIHFLAFMRIYLTVLANNMS